MFIKNQSQMTFIVFFKIQSTQSTNIVVHLYYIFPEHNNFNCLDPMYSQVDFKYYYPNSIKLNADLKLNPFMILYSGFKDIWMFLFPATVLERRMNLLTLEARRKTPNANFLKSSSGMSIQRGRRLPFCKVRPEFSCVPTTRYY